MNSFKPIKDCAAALPVWSGAGPVKTGPKANRISGASHSAKGIGNVSRKWMATTGVTAGRAPALKI